MEKTAGIHKLNKKTVVTAFVALALIVAFVIIAHDNPGADQRQELAKKMASCVGILAACVIFYKWYDKFTVLPVELYQNRHLIWKLAKNDFKKRYAGSYMGAVWAMMQPVVTIAMYYVVFGIIFPDQRESGDVPFVLFLTAGLVPWFYFNEALNNGTNALLEYDYLVKKVVFKISILPIIKVIAATFIHIFFAMVLLFVAAGYGYYPNIYTIQIVYYSVCLFIFVLGLSYITCAIVVFFRDLSQIINIALQLGMWATPILWDIRAIKNQGIVTVLKLNPLVYIVNGYRSAIYEKEWFFQDFFSTMYFWLVTVAVFGLGALIFKRLKVHFADVL